MEFQFGKKSKLGRQEWYRVSFPARGQVSIKMYCKMTNNGRKPVPLVSKRSLGQPQMQEMKMEGHPRKEKSREWELQNKSKNCSSIRLHMIQAFLQQTQSSLQLKN